MSRTHPPKALSVFVLIAVLLAAVSVGPPSAPALAAPGAAAPAQPPALAAVSRVAYIYNTDTASRDSFNTMLTSYGLTVDLVSLAGAETASFTADQVIIIGDDTGSLSTWGTLAAVTNISNAGKPIVGVGKGGYAFFGKLSLAVGWGNGAHGSQSQAYAVAPTQSIYSAPQTITMPSDQILTLYSANQNVVEIYVPSGAPATLIGRDPADPAYYPLISQSVQGRCHTLWGYSGSPAAMTTTGKDLFANMVFGQPCGQQSLASAYTAAPPTIDGAINIGEWSGAGVMSFANGAISVLNDGIRLYVLINASGDTGNDSPTGQTPDYFWLTFDVNGDGQITRDVDLLYSFVPGTTNLRYSYFVAPFQTTTLQPGPIRSSMASGFSCFFADGSLQILGVKPFRFSCSSHRVWEFGIDLREIGAQPGNNARMGVRVSSPNPSFTNDIPANPHGDFTYLTQVSLASLPTPLPTPTGAAVSFQTNPIEVTQAVQDRVNSLPLVADKSSVARAYVSSSGPAAEPAIVYLYGSRSGNDLPGSPLAMLSTARTTIDRNQLNHTTNFLLPKSWITVGATTFQGGAARLIGSPSFTSPFNLTFTTRKTPIYWIIPVNTGTNATPNLVSDATIANQESYLRAIFPVPDVQFVRKPWQSLGAVGPITLDQTIQRLNNYHGSVVLAWVLTVLFTGKEPFALPHQIYGFRPTGGGLSDPTWDGGNGYVAAGFLGTSQEGTMAHEIDHNLDRASAPGTFGRHVGGCGSDGPQPSWPYTNFRINEIGFDTRLPWSTGSGGRDTVIPSTAPDIMSYCQTGRLPTKWISPYRWQQLFTNAFAPPALTTADIAATIGDVYYISGQVHVGGTGSLDPILAQKGMASSGITPGDYSIEVQNAGGSALLTQSFQATFTSPEGEARDTVYFSFQLPQQSGAAKIVLKKGSQVLNTITASASAPSVTLTAPNGGENWSGSQNIQWSASDPDGDTLSFTILYSPDDGNTWLPVASNVQGSSYQVDTAALQGGSGGRIRVIASDGFNNAQDDSNAAFTVAGNPPSVSIASPEANTRFDTGAIIALEGSATDAEDPALADSSFVWSYERLDGSTPPSPTNIGTGPQTSVVLPQGVYRVTLTVSDSTGNTGTAQTTITVNVHRLFTPAILR